VYTDVRTVEKYFPALKVRWKDPDFNPTAEYGDSGDSVNYIGKEHF
jgi:hypothetical protein